MLGGWDGFLLLYISSHSSHLSSSSLHRNSSERYIEPPNSARVWLQVDGSYSFREGGNLDTAPTH